MKEIINALEKIVGADRVSSSELVCQSYGIVGMGGAHDKSFSGIQPQPDMVVLPETAEQVSEILKVANQHKIPITPLGLIGHGGTAGPLQGGILLNLFLMDNIVGIDVDSMKVVAEAGCSYYKMVNELFKKGLMLPHPCSVPGMSVAAAVINEGCGIGKTGFGTVTDLLEGLEVVLPSGEIIRVGSMAYAESDFGPYNRYITGPDLVGLFAPHSNGAFGIITKVALRCARRPKHWAHHSFYWPFEQIEKAGRAIVELTAARIFDIHLNDKFLYTRFNRTLPEDCYFVMNLAVNGENVQELNGREQTIKDICKANRGTYLPGVAEDFYRNWRVKQTYSPQTLSERLHEKSFCGGLSSDLMYPSSRLAEVYMKITELLQKYGLSHPSNRGMFDCYPLMQEVVGTQQFVIINVKDHHLIDQFNKCNEEFGEWFVKKGGTFQTPLPPAAPLAAWTNQMGTINLLKNIKGVLDPNNILSPGTFDLEV